MCWILAVDYLLGESEKQGKIHSASGGKLIETDFPLNVGLKNNFHVAQSMKVLVTGGAGFIGSHLIDLLVERGDEVTIFDNMSSGRAEFFAHHGENVQFVEGDLLNLDAVKAAMDGIDLVFHLARHFRFESVFESDVGLWSRV